MEAILPSRDQYQIINASQLKELLSEGFGQTAHVKNAQELQLNDDLERIQQLTERLDTLKENLQHENQVLEAKRQELTKHLASLKELQTDKIRYKEECRTLEHGKNKLMAFKPNIHDQKIIDSGKKRFQFYKHLTKIRWDYGAMKENVKGYVTNKADYIHHFSYENDNKDTLADNLWKEIELSTMDEHRKTVCDKENIANN